MFEIIVDDRERRSGVHGYLEAASSAHVRIKLSRLRAGDYLILPGATLVERKTVDDFCLSLVDGRLFRQAYRLVAGEEAPLMVIEGRWEKRCMAVGGAAIQGALLTLAQIFRLPLVYTRDPQDTATALLILARQWESHGSRGDIRGRRKSRRSSGASLQVLQSLPGVGRSLAVSLHAHFGSARGVFNAAVQDLQGVPGVGSKRAARIFEVSTAPPAQPKY